MAIKTVVRFILQVRRDQCLRVMLSFCFLIFWWRVFLIAIKVSEKRLESEWGINILSILKVDCLIHGDLKHKDGDG